MFGNFSRRDKQKIVKLVRDRGRQPLSQRDTQRRRPSSQLFERVKMVQTGGADGTASTQATWTYSIKSWDGTETYATSVDPTDATAEPGGIVFRPALGSLTAATEGYVIFIDTNPFVIVCNEGESVAPCSAVGGLSVAEQTALSAVYLLGGM